MNSKNSKTYSIARLVAVAFAAVLAAGLVVAEANAKVGGGGSRGMRTFSAPPVTRTAPNAAQPLNRTTAQPTAPATAGAPATAATGGMFGRPGGFLGGGLMGGLAAGFLGAGLFGLLAGHGFMGGLGGFASFLGLVLQVGLVALLAMLAWRWFQRRSEPAVAGGPSLRDMTANRSGLGNLGLGGGLGGGLANSGLGGGMSGSASSGPSDDIGISPSDYDAFEQLLGKVQAAYSDENIAGLRALATPEMVSYFSEDLAENASRSVVNRVSDVKLLQGDLAEAWREGNVEYASVAMRFSLVDQMFDRATNHAVDGDERPHEVTEVWTFMRARGGNWMVSAIQQA